MEAASLRHNEMDSIKKRGLVEETMLFSASEITLPCVVIEEVGWIK